MNILDNLEECCGCSACYNVCPVNAIKMELDDHGFIYPKINEDVCIHCNQCKTVCPILNTPNISKDSKIYGGFKKDLEQRIQSSSGGLFSSLAEYVLDCGGIVYGVSFDSNQLVHHIAIDKKKDLYKIKGSKYLQSKIDKCYSEIKKLLIEEKLILFSGTPCQIAGLKSYLKKEYTNLITVDVVCHGVPSSTVWLEYLKTLESKSKVEYVNFRNVSNGLSKATVDYYGNNEIVYQEEYKNGIFMKGFIKNLYTRPSCFHCKFKGIERCSDITIGDFWSVKEYYPEIADDYGTSAIIVHTEKGEEILEKISDQLKLWSSTKDKIILWNECIVQSTKFNEKSVEFYERYKNENIILLIDELCYEPVKVVKVSFFERVVRFLKRKVKGLIKDGKYK